MLKSYCTVIMIIYLYKLEHRMYLVNVSCCCFWISKWWDEDMYMKPVSRKENINKHSYIIYLTLSFWYCYFYLCHFGKHISRHHCQFFELGCPCFTSFRKKPSLYSREHMTVGVPNSCVVLRAHVLACV